LIFLLATLAPVYAGATPEELTLEDAIQNALSRNPEVLAAREGLEASKHAVWSARLAFAPSASINSSVTRVDDRTFRVANESLDGLREILEIAVPDQEFDIEPFLYRNTYRTNFQVQLPIYNGGRLWAGLRGANAGRDLSAFAHKAKRDEIALQTRVAFFEHLRAQALEKVARRAVESAEERLETARAGFDVGKRNRSEVLRWEVFLSQRQNDLVQARNGVETSRAALNTVMGYPLGETWSLAEREEDVQELDDFYRGKSIEEFRSSVLSGNLVLRQAEKQTLLADVQKDVTRSGLLPSLNAQFQYGWHEDDDLALDDYNTWNATLAFSYPLDAANLTEHKRARAEARRAQRELENFRRVLLLEATQSFLDVQAAREAVSLQEKALEQAQENLRIVEDRYSAGAATNVDLLDAQVAHDMTQASLVSARYDLIQALSRLVSLEGSAAGDVK
jgi:outer membrane protein TolC